MENATKALIIAGAVLVTILIISLGVGIYNNAAEQAGSVNLSEYEIMQFNDKFLVYEGKSVSASDVNSLVETAFYHNTTYKDDESMRVRVCYNGGGNWSTDEDLADGGKFLVMKQSFHKNTTIRTVPQGYKYFVKAKINATTKLVEQIDVETPDYFSKCREHKH